MSDPKEFITEDLIKQYSLVNNVSREEAKATLIDNFEKESSEVDPRQISLKAIKMIRHLSPKVGGLELRENDNLNRMRSIERQNAELRDEVRKLAEFQQNMLVTYDGVMRSVNNRVTRLEENKGVFRWILNKLKIFLKKKKTN